MQTSIPNNPPTAAHQVRLGSRFLVARDGRCDHSADGWTARSCFGYWLRDGGEQPWSSVTNTKLLAVSMLEQMETLRDTNNLTFGQIANVGQVNNQGAVKTL